MPYRTHLKLCQIMEYYYFNLQGICKKMEPLHGLGLACVTVLDHCSQEASTLTVWSHLKSVRLCGFMLVQKLSG